MWRWEVILCFSFPIGGTGMSGLDIGRVLFRNLQHPLKILFHARALTGRHVFSLGMKRAKGDFIDTAKTVFLYFILSFKRLPYVQVVLRGMYFSVDCAHPTTSCYSSSPSSFNLLKIISKILGTMC